MAESHYNNIFNKKNIEFALDGQNKSLPYGPNSVGEISLKANQIIFTSINNIFQKLLDNDLYNESLLQRYIDFGLIGGPSYVSSLTEIQNTPILGKKFVLSGENGISVLRKEEVNVSDTLSGPYLNGTKTNKIDFFNGRFVACTENGVYESIDKVQWKKAIGSDGVDVVDICYNYGFLGQNVVSAYDYIAIGQNAIDNSIVCYGHNGIDSKWKVLSENEMPFRETQGLSINGLFSFEDDENIYVGTNKGLLRSALKTSLDYFSEAFGTNKLNVYDMKLLEEVPEYERYLLATNYGIKQLHREFGFKDIDVFEPYTGSVYDVFFDRNAFYIATEQGLEIVRSGEKEWQNELKSIKCYSIAKNPNGDFYIGTENGIYLLDTNNIASLLNFAGETIPYLTFLNGRVFAYSSTTDKLWCFENSWFEIRKPNGDSFSNEKVNQLVSKEKTLYVVTSKNIYALSDKTTKTMFLQVAPGNIKYAKTVGNSVIIQNDEFVKLIENGSEVFSIANSNFGNKLIKESEKSPIDDACYLLTNDGTVYSISKNSDDVWIAEQLIIDNDALLAKAIAYYNYSDDFYGLVYIDRSTNNIKLLRNNIEVLSIDNSKQFKDVCVYGGNIYGITNDGHNIFRYDYRSTLGLEKVSDLENGIALKEYLDRNSYVVRSNDGSFTETTPVYLSVFNDGVNVEIENLSNNLLTSGITNADFVGYLDNFNRKKTLLVGTETNGLHAYDLSLNSNGQVIEIASSPTNVYAGTVNAFANVFYRKDNSSNVANAINFIGTDNGLYSLSNSSKFFAQNVFPNELTSINDCISVDGKGEYIAGNSGIYLFNPIGGRKLENLDISSNVHNLTQIKNEEDTDVLIACSDGQNMLLCSEYDSDSGFRTWKQLAPDNSFSTISTKTEIVEGEEIQEEVDCDISARSGYVFDIDKYFISSGESIEDITESCNELTASSSIDLKKILYPIKENGSVKLIDYNGIKYSIALNGDGTFSVNEDGSVEVQTPEHILSSKLTNSEQILEKQLSIGFDSNESIEDNSEIKNYYISTAPTEEIVQDSIILPGNILSDSVSSEMVCFQQYFSNEAAYYLSAETAHLNLSVNFEESNGIVSAKIEPTIIFTTTTPTTSDVDMTIMSYTVSGEYSVDENNNSIIFIHDISEINSSLSTYISDYGDKVLNISYQIVLKVLDINYDDAVQLVDRNFVVDFNLSSGIYSGTKLIEKTIPALQETTDGIYFNQVDSLYGYCLKYDENNWLFFNGDALYSFSGFKTNEKQETIGLANLAQTISSENFNDVYYFKVGDSYDDYPIRKLQISIHSRDFNEAKQESTPGKISEISLEDGMLYAIDNGVLKYSNSSLNFSQINGLTAITHIASCKGYTMALDGNNTVHYIVNGNLFYSISLETFGDFCNFFDDNNGLLCLKTSTGIYRPSVENNVLSLEKISDFTEASYVNAYFKESAFYENYVAIGSNEFFAKAPAYDFKENSYAKISNGIDEKIVDIKNTTTGNSSTQTLLIATETAIKKCIVANLDSIPTITINDIGDGVVFSNIKSIYYNANQSRLYVIDDTSLKIFDNYSSENSLSSANLTVFENFIESEKVSMTDFRNNNPIIVDSSSSNIIGTIMKFLKNDTTFDSPWILLSFVYGSNSDLYFYTGRSLHKLICDENTFASEKLYTFPTKKFTAVKYIETVDDNTIDVWQFNDSKADKIRIENGNGVTEESYDVDNNPNLNDIFYYDGKISLATSNGIYQIGNKSELEFLDNDEVHLAANALVAAKTAKISKLEFLNDSDFIFSYLETIHDDSNTSFDIVQFESSDDAVKSYLNGNYSSIEETVNLIKLFNSYLFIDNGIEGYVYDLNSNGGSKISYFQLEQMNDDVPGIFTAIKYANGKTYCGYGVNLLEFSGFDFIRKYGNVSEKFVALANNFQRGTRVLEVLNDQPDFLIGTTFGLKYVYNDLMTRSFYDKDNAQSINGLVNVIEKVKTADTDEFFIVGQENALFEVTDLKNTKFRKIHEFDSNETVLDVFSIQKNEYIIATTAGIYLTSLTYELINDLSRFTIDNIYDIINDELKKIIANHISQKHGNDSIVTAINKKADNKLSFVSTADEHKDLFDNTPVNSVRVIQNDIIDTIVHGGESATSDSYVKVGLKNWALNSIETSSKYSSDGFVDGFVDPTTGKTFDVSKVPYIVKNWKSGIKEIYVYVPTTGTYYASNPQGISNSTYSNSSRSRANIPNSNLLNSLQNACTTLRVYLYNSYFKIKKIVMAQCVGNSLPLKIYKDNVNADNAWEGVFNTVIQPSALRTLPIENLQSVNTVSNYTDEFGRIYLDFSIYGTDAQAIRIIAES